MACLQMKLYMTGVLALSLWCMLGTKVAAQGEHISSSTCKEHAAVCLSNEGDITGTWSTLTGSGHMVSQHADQESRFRQAYAH